MKCIKEKRTTIVAVREQLQQQQQQNSSSTRTRSAFPTLSFMAITLWLLLLQSTFVAAQTDFNEGKFNALIEKLESDVVKFARQLESFYVDRCQDIQLERCSAGNYDDCQSAYPNPQCLAGESYHVPVCGDEIATNGDGCSGLVDFSISTVRIPTESALGEDKNPTDPQVIETVCYTQAMDEWLQAKRVQDQAYWDEFGVEPWAWYFGSHTGVFRLWPGRQAETCGSYDPRTRPWYVAASSGPKNVIMVLDTSGSMAGLRMSLLKDAAKRVVNTLTVSDRVAIVPFATEALEPIVDTGGTMFIATQENKNILVDQIDRLEAKGRTNIYDAFNTAFDVLDQSAQEEFTVNCNTAIIFLTDGEMTEPENVTEAMVLDSVQKRLKEASRLLPKPILLFTYSVSEQENVHELPSKLACSTKWGVWSKITADANIVDSLSSYYRLFAVGLGTDQDHIAWVEPYIYDPGETLGTSVSVPVYDRSKNPPVFLGVVAIDVSLAALDFSLGIEPGRGSEESIKRIALVSTARCPTLELEECELESFRRQGAAGDAGLCTANCTEFVQVEEEKCPFVSDYPTNLWKNVEIAGLSYIDRVCCIIGQTTTSELCPAGDEEGKERLLIGLLVGGAGFVFCAGLCCWCLYPVEDNDEYAAQGAAISTSPPIIITAPSSAESDAVAVNSSITPEEKLTK